ncbi:MAG: type II secretion system F family protein [Roseovarius sp.]|nr:type II secretion system F family protein [Roseovarius sp.]
MTENLILLAVFVAVLIVSFAVILLTIRNREINRNLEKVSSTGKITQDELDKLLGSDNKQIRYYLEVVQNESPNSLKMRLVRAGFFSRSAPAMFSLLRLLAMVLVFLAVQFGLGAVLPSASNMAVFFFALLAAGVTFILCAAVLDRLGRNRTREYRKLFPDFMDLLLVCVDAGLSINAAIDRVTREFLVTTPDFGVQLAIINLEIRAGRSLHEALLNFSERIEVEEARTLAVLFKQSAELGASVSKTLRSFSKEMRQMRLIRAEEKANSLPIKMLFPMALFMFPVNLVIVLLPIMLVIVKMLVSMSPV